MRSIPNAGQTATGTGRWGGACRIFTLRRCAKSPWNFGCAERLERPREIGLELAAQFWGSLPPSDVAPQKQFEQGNIRAWFLPRESASGKSDLRVPLPVPGAGAKSREDFPAPNPTLFGHRKSSREGLPGGNLNGGFGGLEDGGSKTAQFQAG